MSGGSPQDRDSGPRSIPLKTGSQLYPLRHLALAGFSYLGIYLGLSWSWLANARTSSGVGINHADEPLVAWILGWVRLALATRPSDLFDAPINYPAPLQLAASEHLLSAQVLFAPLYSLTNETLLAANLTLFLTYPIGALITYRFLVAVGVAHPCAFAVGLAYSLGPFQVPANLHLLQSLNLFLPLVALALVRLRETPRAPQCVALTICSLLAFLSSYYTALITAVGAAVWGLQELLRTRPGRTRFFVSATLAVSVSAGVLLLFSLPYFEYREMAQVHASAGADLSAIQSINQTIHDETTRWMRPELFLFMAALSLALGPASSRRCAAVAIVLFASTPLFVRVLEVPGLEFFRHPFRFAVLTGFGWALAAAAILESLRSRLGYRTAAAVSCALAIFVLVDRGGVMLEAETTSFVDAPLGLATRIREIAADRGQGPMLELPVLAPLQSFRRIKGGTEARSMLLSLEHGLPLIVGHSGYLPRHRSLIKPFLSLRSVQALQHLVDATGLRWILVRPIGDWPARLIRTRATLLSLPGVTHRLAYEGWELLEVDLRPSDLLWIEAIGSGGRSNATVLGTPLRRLPRRAQRGRVSLDVPSKVTAGKNLWITASIQNQGKETWPAAIIQDETMSPFTVRAFASWRRIRDADEPGGGVTSVKPLPLRWDLRPGMSLHRIFKLAAPSLPGRYALQVAVGQGEDATRAFPGVEAAEASVEVRPPRLTSPLNRVD